MEYRTIKHPMRFELPCLEVRSEHAPTFGPDYRFGSRRPDRRDASIEPTERSRALIIHRDKDACPTHRLMDRY